MQVYDQGGRPNCDAKQWGDTKSGALGDGSPPVGSRGEALVVGLGDFVPSDAESFLLILNKILQTLVTFWSHLKLCIYDDEFDD